MGSWVALPRMQRPRFHPGAVVLDGKLYVAGGYDANTHREPLGTIASLTIKYRVIHLP